jgi:hypothetical protein
MVPYRPDVDLFDERFCQPKPMKKSDDKVRWALLNSFCISKPKDVARDSAMAANMSFDNQVPLAISRRTAVHH